MNKNNIYWFNVHSVQLLNFYGIKIPGSWVIKGGLFCIDMEEIYCIIEQLFVLKKNGDFLDEERKDNYFGRGILLS